MLLFKFPPNGTIKNIKNEEIENKEIEPYNNVYIGIHATVHVSPKWHHKKHQKRRN